MKPFPLFCCTMRVLLALITVTITFSVTAQTNAEKWDLRKCVDYAVKNNISVKQADVQARLSALQMKQAKMFQYPTASFNTNLGPQFGRSIDPTTNIFTNTELFAQSYGVQGGIQVFNWGRIKNNIAAAEFSAKAALVDVEKVTNDISLNVATFYLQVLASKEQMNIASVQIAQTKSQLEITRKRVEAGALPELNAIELEARLANDSSNYINAQSTFQQNVLTLKGVLNIDAALPFEVETPSIEKIPLETLADLQPESVFQMALNNLPTQKSNLLKVKAAEKNILVNKATLYPTISSNYSLGTTYNNKDVNFITGVKTPYFDQINRNFRQNLGIGVSVPIFNSGQNRINYEQSKLNLTSAKVQEEQDNQKLKQDIYTAYNNVINATQKFNASKKSVESSQKAYDFALKRYEVGLLNTLDLITNQNNLLTAKLQLIANQFDYVFRMKLLEFYKGNGMKL